MNSNLILPYLNKISVVIAAAGKGSRSGLDYPKCLFKIDDLSILERILKKLRHVDDNPKIIVSPSGYRRVLDELRAANSSADLIIQDHPNGMGDAVLQLDPINSELNENILLIWGDVPFISIDTINRTILRHFTQNNSFTLPTITTKNPYTIVKRNKENEISGIIETKNKLKKSIPSYGERDLGLFLFKKDIVLKLLKQDLPNKFNNEDSEHGFLYLIEHLFRNYEKIGSVKVKNLKESLSLNSIEDLQAK